MLSRRLPARCICTASATNAVSRQARDTGDERARPAPRPWRGHHARRGAAGWLQTLLGPARSASAMTYGAAARPGARAGAPPRAGGSRRRARGGFGLVLVCERARPARAWLAGILSARALRRRCASCWATSTSGTRAGHAWLRHRFSRRDARTRAAAPSPPCLPPSAIAAGTSSSARPTCPKPPRRASASDHLPVCAPALCAGAAARAVRHGDALRAE